MESLRIPPRLLRASPGLIPSPRSPRTGFPAGAVYVLALLFVASVSGAEPPLNPPQPNLQTGFWLDDRGTADLKAAMQAPFILLQSPNFGRRHGALWARVAADNPGPAVERLLRVGPSLLKQVDLWVPGPQGHFQVAGGLKVPMEKRVVPDRESLFAVILPTGHSEFYIRIASPTLLAPVIELWQTRDWQSHARLTDRIHASALGGLVMIVVMILVYAVMTREWHWLYYGLATAAFTVFESCDDGMAAILFWPGRPTLSLAMVPIAVASQIWLYVLFFMSFIPVSGLHHGWRLLWALPVTAGVGLALAYGVDYRVGVPLLYGVVLATDVAMFLLTVAAWRKGFRGGRWALPGFGLVLAAILHRMGILRGWWTDLYLANYWLLPVSGVISSGILLMAQIDQLREFRAAEQRYLAEIHAARDRARQANRAKSFLLARVSHDLRAPLQILTGYLELARLEPVSRAVGRRLDAIQTGCRQMLALIGELLEFARGEEGRPDLNARPTYLYQWVQEIAGQGEVLSRRQGNRFAFDLDLSARIAVVDAEALRMVLLNLLGMANRMMVNGTLFFSVLGHTTGGEVRLRFEVRTAGLHIQPDDERLLILPHERTMPGWTGLGLPTVRQWVRAMGGTLHRESAPGYGRVFAVALTTEAGDEADIVPPPAIDVPHGYQGRRRTLLLVDSVAVHLNFMQDLLTGMGFAVLTATRVDEALALAAGARPDGAVVEQFLEDGDGLELLVGLKAMAPERPVILLSSAPVRLKPDRGRKRGFDAELLKPPDPPRLVEVLGRCLSLTWRSDSALARSPDPRPDPPPGPLQVADLTALREAARAGRFFEVMEWIDRWKQASEEQRFMEQIAPLAAAAKWMAIMGLVDRRLAAIAPEPIDPDAENSGPG